MNARPAVCLIPADLGDGSHASWWSYFVFSTVTLLNTVSSAYWLFIASFMKFLSNLLLVFKLFVFFLLRYIHYLVDA